MSKVWIGVVGTRTFNDYDKFVSLIDSLGNPFPVNRVVTGGAKGVDEMAQRYAKEEGLKCQVFLPDYEQYGNSAPHVRNREIVKHSDYILAFWDGKSKGTLSTISQAVRLGKRVHIYPVGEHI